MTGLQHVTLEVPPGEIERSVEFWQLLGFERVEPPAALAETFVWMERGGTQIHLERNESPVVPPHGHAAVVVENFEARSSACARPASRCSRAASTGARRERRRPRPASTWSS